MIGQIKKLKDKIGDYLFPITVAEAVFIDKNKTIKKYLTEVESYITPLIFGAKGDGTTNDGVALQNTFTYASTNKLSVDLKGLTYLINQDMVMQNITVKNGKIVKGSITNRFYLIGTTTIDNIEIYMSGDCKNSTISIINGSGVNITNCIIYGQIGCKTKAYDTTIKNSTIKHGNYGILFNDTDPNRTYGTDTYTGTIGSGLFIKECNFVVMANSQEGDTIEINCPTYRFDNIQISGCSTYLNSGVTRIPSTSIGFGFAQCDNVYIKNNIFNGVGSNNGTIHLEWCKNAFVDTNTCINNTHTGIWVEQGEDIQVTNNLIDVCTRGICLISDLAVSVRINVKNNTIKHMKEYAIYGAGVKYCEISDNSMIEPVQGTSNFTFIMFYDNAQGGLSYSRVWNNRFYKGSSTAKLELPINVKTTGCTNNDFRDNIAIDFFAIYQDIGSNNSQQGYMPTVYPKYYILDKSPIGFIPAYSDSWCFDYKNGNLYRAISGSWVKVATYNSAVL